MAVFVKMPDGSKRLKSEVEAEKAKSTPRPERDKRPLPKSLILNTEEAENAND